MTRRRKILFAAAFVVALSVLVGLRTFASRMVLSRLVDSARDVFGVELAIDDLSLEFWSGKATAHGVRIRDAGVAVIEAERVELSASARDLFGGTYDIHELVLVRPVLHVVVEPSRTTNLARIFGRRESSGAPHLVVLRDARVLDGRCVLEDAHTDAEHPLELDLEGVEVAVTDLQLAGEPRRDVIGDIRVDARLVQKHSFANIAVVGWTSGFRQPLSIALHAAVTGLDLAAIAPYVKKSTRRALGGDVLHIVGALRAEEGAIEDGAIAAEVVETGAKLSLRFGGTLSNVVFDEDSKLAALFELPFARLGHLGNVALTSTWGSAVELGGGLRGAGESVVGGVAGTVDKVLRLDPLGALGAAGGGLVGGVEALGGGVVGGVKAIFGSQSRSDEEKERARDARAFEELHAQRRRAMIEAALAVRRSSRGTTAARPSRS
ncbi:MAG: DUF748 domain-containing protein [Planctomycetota bacterium]|nr:MAG: DUF748 domain-containing protein [Planctomycetota bacterium]